MKRADIAKRTRIKRILASTLVANTITQAPYVFAKHKTQIRVLGTHATLQEPLREEAMKDLGIALFSKLKATPLYPKKHLYFQRILMSMNNGQIALTFYGRQVLPKPLTLNA